MPIYGALTLDTEAEREGYARHRHEQRLHLMRETTPQQRFEWLEETLLFLWESGLIPSKLPPAGPDQAS